MFTKTEILSMAKRQLALVNEKCKLYFPAHKDIVYSYEELEDFYNRYIKGEIIRNV